EALDVDRSSVRYRSTRPDDRELRETMKTVASQRRRFGYRRIHVMLQRQGLEMNIKEAPAALWRGEAAGPQARWPQASPGHAASDAGARSGQPTLEPRLRVRCLHRWATLPGAHRGGRPHARVPGTCRGHLAWRPARRA